MGEVEQAMVEYVVQVQEAMDPDRAVTGLWRDVATIEVPGRTRRRTVVQRAGEAVQGEASPGVPQLVRVLGPEDAAPFRVSTVVPPPELRIEGVDGGNG